MFARFLFYASLGLSSGSGFRLFSLKVQCFARTIIGTRSGNQPLLKTDLEPGSRMLSVFLTSLESLVN
jgi:hypothetical protein